MLISRRNLVLAAAAAGLGAPAQAQTAAMTKHAGYRAWMPPQARGARIPLTGLVDTGDTKISLGEFMEGRPAVLSAWATWCGPCLAEKESQARMSARLVKANSRLRFLALQAFDDVSLAVARRRLRSLNAATLTNAQAGHDVENALIGIFGRSPVDPQRTSMPALVLAAEDGTILGQAIGMMFNPDETRSYWEDEATFEFLSKI